VGDLVRNFAGGVTLDAAFVHGIQRSLEAIEASRVAPCHSRKMCRCDRLETIRRTCPQRAHVLSRSFWPHSA